MGDVSPLALPAWRTAKPIDLLARLVDRLGAGRRLGRLRSTRPVNRFADAVYHAQLVEESFRFGARELLARRGPEAYRPRDRSSFAAIRHRTGDLYVLNEVVRHRAYRFPPEVVARLDSLERPPRVVDAGANIGLFGIEVLERFPQATVTAFEPDPANADIHELTIGLNSLDGRWQLIRSCVGTADGTVEFEARGSVGSRIASSPRATRVPIVDLFPHLGQTDLLKMDIEGSEWPILFDPRFHELDDLVVVFEYHADACPYPDAREAALRALSSAGYDRHESDAPRQPAGTGVIWAWK